jgi:hypothetical protein
MMTRTTLNGQPPRTLQDTARDPYDWWEGPRVPGAERIFRIGNGAMVVLAVVCALSIIVPAAWHAVARWLA